jgi:hypothetical protein
MNEGIVTAYHNSTVETGILKYTEFHPAHEEHQQYLMKNSSGYCNHYFRFREWPVMSKRNGRMKKKSEGLGGKIMSSFSKLVSSWKM